VKHENIPSPFVTDMKIPSFENSNCDEIQKPLFKFNTSISRNDSKFEQQLGFNSEQKPFEDINNTISMSNMPLFKRKLDQFKEIQNISNEHELTSDLNKNDYQTSSHPSSIQQNSNQFNFLNQSTLPYNHSNFNNTNTSSPFIFGGQQNQNLNQFNNNQLSQNISGNNINTGISEYYPTNPISPFIGITSSNQQQYSGYPNTPQQFEFPSIPTNTNTNNLQFGTGKNLFNGFFEENDTLSQLAKPSIGYNVPKKDNQDGSNIFNGSIFSSADDDPFERSNRFGKKKDR